MDTTAGPSPVVNLNDINAGDKVNGDGDSSENGDDDFIRDRRDDDCDSGDDIFVIMSFGPGDVRPGDLCVKHCYKTTKYANDTQIFVFS